MKNLKPKKNDYIKSTVWMVAKDWKALQKRAAELNTTAGELLRALVREYVSNEN